MNNFPTVAVLSLLALTLAGCAGTRELNIARPTVQSRELPALAGANAVDGDDYYVQILSEFAFAKDVGENEVCRDFGGSYRKGGMTSAVLFEVRNDTLKLRREVPGLLYRSASGRCSFSLDAKKAYMTPWMRLDSGQDAQVDYRFITSSDDDLDLARLGNDVSVASNVLALTGVGTGVALVGKLASGWMLNSSQSRTESTPEGGAATAKRREDNRSLPAVVAVSGGRATVNRITLNVLETAVGSMDPFAKPRILGELSVLADVRPSLLLKTGNNGLPDARDLSLAELWRSSIRNGADGTNLKATIEQADHPDRPNLQPDWNNYRDVELNCRKLKVVMRDLGFNKFDRNAVLYYFLENSEAWKNYNFTGRKALEAETPVKQLERYRANDFGGCLVEEDYAAMKALALMVNGSEDWDNTLRQLREKESYMSTLHAVERQLGAVLRNPNPAELERQVFPLIASRQSGVGTVLLQDRLGNFGIEKLLTVPSVPGEGIILTSAQLAQLFTGLKFVDTSCARPVFERGRPVPNVAILLFATAPDSPLPKGGALEFEFDGSRAVRLALQSPSFRDFRQDIIDNPQSGDCHIDAAWLQRL